MKAKWTPAKIVVFVLACISLIMLFIGALLNFWVTFLSGCICMFIACGFALITIGGWLFTSSFESSGDIIAFVCICLVFIISLVEGISIVVLIS